MSKKVRPKKWQRSKRERCWRRYGQASREATKIQRDNVRTYDDWRRFMLCAPAKEGEA